MKNVCLIGCIFTMIFAASFQGASAHMVFKKALQKKHKFKSVTCNACHVPREHKSKRNEFGDEFAKLLKDQEITKRFNEAKEQGTEARKEFEKEMDKQFLKVLTTIEAKKSPQGPTYLELMKDGKIDGVKVE